SYRRIEVEKASRTILVVDDQEDLREIIKKRLEKEGYRVLVAGSFDEALDVVDRQSSSIDILLTDIILPTKSGHELAQKVLSAHPETKIVYMSGYVEQELHEQLSGECALILTKPFKLEVLLVALEDLSAA
ncbi:MAG: response regulator, partial [Bdellovibrionota bacterium]